MAWPKLLNMHIFMNVGSQGSCETSTFSTLGPTKHRTGARSHRTPKNSERAHLLCLPRDWYGPNNSDLTCCESAFRPARSYSPAPLSPLASAVCFCLLAAPSGECKLNVDVGDRHMDIVIPQSLFALSSVPLCEAGA